jgi:hypothetical protein
MVGYKRMSFFFNFSGETNFVIRPVFQFPDAQYSNIPAFQHSNRTTWRLSTGWGEAPNRSFFSGLFVVIRNSGQRYDGASTGAG